MVWCRRRLENCRDENDDEKDDEEDASRCVVVVVVVVVVVHSAAPVSIVANRTVKVSPSGTEPPPPRVKFTTEMSCALVATIRFSCCDTIRVAFIVQW